MIQLYIDEDQMENHHFSVKNQTGEIQYLIEGYWGKKGDRINLLSKKGKLLLQAKQTNISPFFNFDLLYNREKIGSIRKHPGFFGLRDAFFTVHPKDWIVRGDFEKVHFSIFKEEEEIAKINKLLKHANYRYSLKIKARKDGALISLLAILFDHYSRNKGREEKIEELFQKNYKFGFINYRMDSELCLDKYLAENKKRVK